MDTAKPMRQHQGAAAGFVAQTLGIGGASFERSAQGPGMPPEQVAAFFIEYRSELLVQGLWMVSSLGALSAMSVVAYVSMAVILVSFFTAVLRTGVLAC